MANPWEGEVAIRLDGERHVMRLTLGALAELEAELQQDTLIGLVERFESGQFSASDILSLIAAGLRGGGWQGDRKDLISSEIEGGPLEAARLAAALLARSFACPGQ